MAINVYLRSKIEERTACAAVLDNLTKTASDKGRDLTDDERRTYDEHVKRCNFLDDEIKRIADAAEGAKKFVQIYGAFEEAEEKANAAREREAARRPAPQPVEERLSWGERFVRSDQFKSYGGHGTSAEFKIEGTFLKQGGLEERVVKTDDFGDRIPTMEWSGPTIPGLRTPLFDVIGVVPTNMGSVEYYYWKLNDPAHMASEVPEGEIKPEAPLEGELKTVPIATYAWWKGVTRQALEDLPMIRNIIDTQLRRGIIRKLNSEAATALTTNTDIEDASGGDGLIAQMRTAIGQIDDLGFAANAVLLNPMDWAALDTGLFPTLQRDTSAPRGPQQMTNFWGLRPIAVSGLPSGTAYVGDFAEGMTFFDRNQVQVLMTDSHADFFVRNQFAILAECRGKVVVTNAASIIKCVGAGSGSGNGGGEGFSAPARSASRRQAAE